MHIVQTAAVAEILRGGDVLLASHTGSGKTLAYLLPLVDRLQLPLHKFLLKSHPAQSLDYFLELYILCCSTLIKSAPWIYLMTCSIYSIAWLATGEAAAGCGKERRSTVKTKAAARYSAGSNQGVDGSNPECGQVHQPPCKVQISLREWRSVLLSVSSIYVLCTCHVRSSPGLHEEAKNTLNSS